jgi:hypothetical protein
VSVVVGEDVLLDAHHAPDGQPGRVGVLRAGIVMAMSVVVMSSG